MKKTENSCLVSGDVRLFLADVESNETTTIELEVGQRVCVHPFPLYANKFVAVSKVQMIEYYAKPFDLAEDIRYDGFKGDDNVQ